VSRSVTIFLASEDALFLYITDDEPGQIVIGRSIETGHFRGLTAYQGTSVFAAAGGDPRHHRFYDCRIECSERDVVEEEQRQGTLDQDIVDAMIDQVAPDRFVPISLDRNFDLRSDTVGAGD
jgi:hypothetical protein